MTPHTSIEVTAVAGGRARCRFATGHLSPRRVRTTDGSVRVALVAATALLLAGDDVCLDVVVDGPVHLDLVETAGTVAYAMRGGRATWDVDVVLRGGAVLTWAGEPFLVSDGADVTRSFRMDLGPDCLAVVRESLVLGRSGETGGVLRASTSVSIDDLPLVVEELDLAPGARSGWGVLGPHRCIETVSSYGFRLPAGPDGEGIHLALAGAGSVVRRLGSRTHLNQLGGTWEHARAAASAVSAVRSARGSGRSLSRAGP